MSIIDLTQETNGGGSGGDIHNLGWYSTPEALKEAHPTASNGDFAIVGTTDSVWVWDSDTSNWLDTKSSGLVESVNGKTGEVVLKTSDLENDSEYITKDIDNLTNYLTSTEVNTLLDGKININEKGTPDGVATLGADSKIPLNQLKVIDDVSATETTTYSSKKIDETFAKTTDIPTKVSELENDSKYITKEVNDLTYYSTAAEVNDLLQTKINLTEKGIANGVATLGDDSKIPLNQLKVIDDVSATETTTYSSKKVDELLNTKADDTAVVHKTGAETIEGAKTFKNDVTAASLSLTNDIFTITKDNQAIIRNTTTGETIVSNINGSTNGLCLRPNGTDESEGQVIINKDGTINGIVTKAQADAEGNTISTTYAKANAVVHITGNESIAGVKTFTDNAKIGSIEKTANLDIVGNLNIQGNIVQNGQAYETHAEKVYTTNDYIILRDGAKAGLAIGEYSGLEYIKYDGTNNGRLVIDNTGTARVGDIGDEQPLLTRDEKANLSNGAVLIWDDATNKAIKASEKGSNTLPVYVNIEGNLEPIESYEGNSATSTKAEQDSEGQQITSTYIKEIAITGTDLTYTKGDGTAATIATQDTQVESVISATNTNYPILLNNGTGATTSKANIDIEMYANPSTNTIGASTFKVGNKVNISINTYTNALDFNWV